MARSRDLSGVVPEAPYGLVAQRVVEARTEQLFEEARDVLDLGDIERVHDMRVATRRLRAALEIFRPCFPRSRYKAALRDVKALADALGERRDRDVTIEVLERLASELDAGDRNGVAALITDLRGAQERANESLAPHVSAVRMEELRGRLRALAAAARS